VQIGLSDAGRAVAAGFRADALFDDISHRADVVLDAVGSMSATRLKDFVYETVPEIVDMKWGQEIEL